MNCKKAQYLIQEYLEDKLDTAEELELSRHLQECDKCRAEMEDMEKADLLFSSQTWFSPPDKLQEDIMLQIEQTDIVSKALKGSSHSFWYILLTFGQFCLTIIVFIAIKPGWLLPERWMPFFKSISVVLWDYFLALKNSVEASLKWLQADNISFGGEFYNLLFEPSLIKTLLILALLILTLYLNGKLLFKRGNFGDLKSRKT